MKPSERKINRLSKRSSILQENISVYDVCLKLKMSADGSSDPLSDEDQERYCNYLETVLDTWVLEPGNVLSMNFDFAVRNLVIATLAIYPVGGI